MCSVLCIHGHHGIFGSVICVGLCSWWCVLFICHTDRTCNFFPKHYLLDFPSHVHDSVVLPRAGCDKAAEESFQVSLFAFCLFFCDTHSRTLTCTYEVGVWGPAPQAIALTNTRGPCSSSELAHLKGFFLAKMRGGIDGRQTYSLGAVVFPGRSLGL